MSTDRPTVPPCISCGTTTRGRPRSRARGLCEPCYSHNRLIGNLDAYQRTYRKRADLMEDLDFLGFDTRLPVRPQLINIAHRIGISHGALDKAFYRARKAGAI